MRMDKRSKERIKFHYLIERDLARKLSLASSQQRKAMYNSIYDELFSKVLDHPALTRVTAPKEREEHALRQYNQLKNL